ncbi:1-deoxy-D-xylulose 5-phosphate reductoisomerase [Advenella kashmirensis W13003]|uniref:1-deoxy-D-xylulose 5-phosphate reductoisomerase n=1 Tax=Advenella kashmirensis W13003 TaxID=1424334 RepID=V8QPP6_9BURK|nr:1-deoxy-D-xylulose-5-phosphate reductoisomerase [Advenella kashmirensis]ETF01936.1 1-deoxy-D-xylulose 5-phosphate reductoisomerase [Advenella kashmirensis W13003]
MQNITIFGATGSIGDSTLDIVRRHPDRFRVYALSAQRRMKKLAELALAFAAKVIIVPDVEAVDAFREHWPADHALPEIRLGERGLCETARDPETDCVVAAIVGIAGLASAFEAAQAGKRILLANKEALVAAGELFMHTVQAHDAQLLPVDSEHNAIFQCLQDGRQSQHIRRIVLTASGGPFRNTPLHELETVTPAQACRHPNWSMGQKISVDSATMLNKGLEVIEAHYLFGLPAGQIDVVIHPESTVHSMVEFIDGSLLAQLGNTDMRIPISYVMGYPERIESNTPAFDLSKLHQLNFSVPDYQRFPCLRLAFDALAAGQAQCIALNAANEIAVAHFLQGRLRFPQIAQVIERALDWQSGQSGNIAHIDDVFQLDRQVRERATAFLPASV